MIFSATEKPSIAQTNRQAHFAISNSVLLATLIITAQTTKLIYVMSLLNVRLTPVDQRIRSPVSQAQRTPANRSTTTTHTIAISHGTASSTPRSYIEPTMAAKPPCTASLFRNIAHLSFRQKRLNLFLIRFHTCAVNLSFLLFIRNTPFYIYLNHISSIECCS